jgi:hypothetical protein
VRDDVEAALSTLQPQEAHRVRHAPLITICPSRRFRLRLDLTHAEGTVKSMLFRSIRKLRDRLSP